MMTASHDSMHIIANKNEMANLTRMLEENGLHCLPLIFFDIATG